MKEILKTIEPGRPLAVFLDYDGTLVPIQRHPEGAVLPPSRKSCLKSLGARMFVGLVSGRSLADIRIRVGLDELSYIGNHGLEMAWGRKTWVHPEAKKRQAPLGLILSRIMDRTLRFPGILIENKGLTGSIHYRRADAALVEPLKRIVAEETARETGLFRIGHGKKVFEILPAIDWNKGDGIRMLLGRLPRLRRVMPIFIGDDRTDEDAFRRIGRNTVTIHVGCRGGTSAQYCLADVAQVWRFLAECLRAGQGKMIGSRPDRHRSGRGDGPENRDAPRPSPNAGSLSAIKGEPSAETDDSESANKMPQRRCSRAKARAATKRMPAPSRRTSE